MRPLRKVEIDLFHKRRLDNLMAEASGKPLSHVMPHVAMRFDRMELTEQIDVITKITNKMIERRQPSFLSRLFGFNFHSKKIAQYEELLKELDTLKKDVALRGSLDALHIPAKEWNVKMTLSKRLDLIHTSAEALLSPENKLTFSQKNKIREARKDLCTLCRKKMLYSCAPIKIPLDCKVTSNKIRAALATIGVTSAQWNHEMDNPDKQYQMRYELLGKVEVLIKKNKKHYKKEKLQKMVEAIKILNILMNDEHDSVKPKMLAIDPKTARLAAKSGMKPLAKLTAETALNFLDIHKVLWHPKQYDESTHLVRGHLLDNAAEYMLKKFQRHKHLPLIKHRINEALDILTKVMNDDEEKYQEEKVVAASIKKVEAFLKQPTARRMPPPITYTRGM